MEITTLNEYTKGNKTYRTLIIDNLHAECEVVDGKLNGLCECTTVDLNDNLRRIVLKQMRFKDDELDGDYIVYNLKGLILQEGTYKNGKLHGVVKRYSTLGDVSILKTVQMYKDNKLDGLSTIYNTVGTVISENNYKNDKYHGEQRTYNINGSLSMRHNYLNGLLIDEYTIYNGFGEVTQSYFYNIFEGVSIGYSKKTETIKFQGLPIALDVDLVCSLMFTPSKIKEIEHILEIEYSEFEVLNSIVNSKKHFIAFFKTMEKQKVKLSTEDFN